VFDVIGRFDEAYFLYWEEIDLCQRARDAGFTLGICPGIEVVHRPGEIGGVETERSHRVYYMWRNQFRFAFRTWGVLGALFLARRSVTLLRDAWRYARAGRVDLLRAAGAGLRAGLDGECGRSRHPAADPDRSPRPARGRRDPGLMRGAPPRPTRGIVQTNGQRDAGGRP
jgi:GT2 family glycosyltransferase